MNDITELFRSIAAGVDVTPSDDTVSADLARGRSALLRAHRQRTIRRSMTAATALAAGVAVLVVATQVGGGSNSPSQAAGHAPNTATRSHPAVQKHPARIKLVSYTGKQLAGFTVDTVPAGWYPGAVSQYALTINAADDHNTNPDVFENKLTVLLASQDETSFPKHGDKVTVNGQSGIIWNGGEEMLGYTDAAGHRIVVQYPDALNWNDDQMVAFAQGVHVTSDALAGRG
jgi:hypothetical protein